MIIIVDSDGLIAVSSLSDAHYSLSTGLLEKLVQYKAKFIYPATTIAEATTLLQTRLNMQDSADQIIERVKSGLFQVEPINQETLVEASYLLDKKKKQACHIIRRHRSLNC